MADLTASSLTEHFIELDDPCIQRTKRHDLRDISVIAVCAVICGVDNSVEIEKFGRPKQEWLEKMLGPSKSIPTHDTFGRVFARLVAAHLETFFVR